MACYNPHHQKCHNLLPQIPWLNSILKFINKLHLGKLEGPWNSFWRGLEMFKNKYFLCLISGIMFLGFLE